MFAARVELTTLLFFFKAITPRLPRSSIRGHRLESRWLYQELQFSPRSLFIKGVIQVYVCGEKRACEITVEPVYTNLINPYHVCFQGDGSWATTTCARQKRLVVMAFKTDNISVGEHAQCLLVRKLGVSKSMETGPPIHPCFCQRVSPIHVSVKVSGS